MPANTSSLFESTCLTPSSFIHPSMRRSPISFISIAFCFVCSIFGIFVFIPFCSLSLPFDENKCESEIDTHTQTNTTDATAAARVGFSRLANGNNSLYWKRCSRQTSTTNWERQTSCVFYVRNKVQYRRQRATFAGGARMYHSALTYHVWAKSCENCHFETPKNQWGKRNAFAA